MFELALMMMQLDAATATHRYEAARRETERKLKWQKEYAEASHDRRMEMLAEEQIEATRRLTEEIRKKDMAPKHYHEHRSTNVFY